MMEKRCVNGHTNHSELLVLGDQDPLWLGLIDPGDGRMSRWEPCPETDPRGEGE